MDRVGVLVVSKCLSSAAMMNAFARSTKYRPEFYVAEKQANPFSLARAKVHAVVPDLNLGAISKFVRRHRDRISFGVTDTEDFVVSGGRDAVEREAGVQMVCVSKKYAVERSKAEQRLLFDDIFREANPRYRIFERLRGRSPTESLAGLAKTVAEMKGVVIKPDAPSRGAGVGVWGKDFREGKEMDSFFLDLLSRGRVVVEEMVEGEESSFHAFSDGKHFIPGPLVRDYKRSLDHDRGKLTGGMGSYRGPGVALPFLRDSEVEHLVDAEEKAFRRWKGRGSDPGLRGIVLYDAIMHTGRGFKVLERNSRGGNTEVVNLLATMADDFVDVCHRILDGSLKGIRFRRAASVVTCAVPLSYGVNGRPSAAGEAVNLDKAHEAAAGSRGTLSIFPMDLRRDRGMDLTGASRSVAVVGIGERIEEARRLSLSGVRVISGPLRWRSDIGARSDIRKSALRMQRLRRVGPTSA